MTASAVIFGCSDLALSDQELDLFRNAAPWGLILFARNVDNPDQVRALIRSFRNCVGRQTAPVFIDQEGGRVARLKPPHWRAAPPAAVFGALYAISPEKAREACYLNARLLADELTELGITADCAPVLDVPTPGSHQIIGDRAFSSDPAIVADLGRQFCAGLLAGGVLPVIKHIPGHGRAGADSHLDLPRVDTRLSELQDSDLVPFRAMAAMPLAMTAHVAYTAIDGLLPASHSRTLIHTVIRKEAGFTGALMCDDLGMAALEGNLPERAQKALEAGCDLVLHCSGVMAEMQEVMRTVPTLSGVALERCEAALTWLQKPDPFDRADAEARLATLLEP